MFALFLNLFDWAYKIKVISDIHFYDIFEIKIEKRSESYKIIAYLNLFFK